MMSVRLSVVLWISAALSHGSNNQGEMYEICLETPCNCCKNGSCSGPGKCDGCIDGFTGPSCMEPCPANCFNCAQTFYQSDTDKVCYKCNSGSYNGQYQDVTNYTFQHDCSLTCNTGCENCTSFHRCNRCKSGYFMSGEQCKSCTYKCDKCLSSNTCIKCANGYNWNAQNCEKCQPNCKLCKSPTICEECNANFFLKEGDCISCPNGCLSCNTTDSCNTCQTQYYLHGNQCFACRENCAMCSFNKSQYICNKCIEGYYGLNQTCIKCGAGCALCKTNNDCFACKTGFSLYNGTCYDNQFPDSTIERIIASTLPTNKRPSLSSYVGIVIGSIAGTALILLAVFCFARKRNQIIRSCETEKRESRCSIIFKCFRQVLRSTPQQPSWKEDDESRLPLNRPDTNNIDTVDKTRIANGIEENGQISRAPEEITSAQVHHTKFQRPDTNNIDTVDETRIANGIEENGQISRAPKEITSAQVHHTKSQQSTPGLPRPKKPPKSVKVKTLKENFDSKRINFKQEFKGILKELKLESEVSDELAVGQIKRIDMTYNSKRWEPQPEHDVYIIYIASRDTMGKSETMVLKDLWARETHVTTVVKMRNGKYSKVKIGTRKNEQGNETKKLQIKLFDMLCPSENYCNQTTLGVITNAVMDLQKEITNSSKDSKIPTLFYINDDNRDALRTIGTYIAFDQLVKNAQETGCANVPLCVQILLKQCPLIKSSDHYEFIYSVLVRWIGRSKVP